MLGEVCLRNQGNCYQNWKPSAIVKMRSVPCGSFIFLKLMFATYYLLV